MRWAVDLRRELSARNQQIAVTNGSLHELTTGETPSVIFAAWKFLSGFVPKHLRKSGMGAQAGEGPYRIAQGIAPRGLAMEGAGLREQFGRAAYEYLLLPAHTEQPCLEFNAGGFFRKRAAVWIQAGNSPAQRQDGPHRDRHETGRPHGGGQADGNRFSKGAGKND